MRWQRSCGECRLSYAPGSGTKAEERMLDELLASTSGLLINMTAIR